MNESATHESTNVCTHTRQGITRCARWAALRIGNLVLAIALFGSASAADILVYSGGAAQPVLRALAPDFEARTGHRVSFTFAVVTEIQQKLMQGDRADVVLLPVPLLAAAEKVRALRSESRAPLGRVGIGVIVRQGVTHPDISSAEAVRTMLLQARRIALPDLTIPTGAHLTRVFGESGMADAITPKLLYKAAIAGGTELLANGEADVGLYLLSELRAAKGIDVVGLLPPPFQNFIVYAAAVPVDSSAPEAALAFVRFISDPAQGERWSAAGFELASPIGIR